MDKKKPRFAVPGKLSAYFTGVVLALCTYLLLIVCRFMDASVLNRDNEYFVIIILQMMVFLLPAFAFLLARKKPFRDALPLSGMRADHILLIIGAFMLLCFGSLLIEMAVGLGELPTGSFSLYDTFISKNDGTVPRALYLILAYGALPACCEELIYRGIFCTEYREDGAFCSIGMSMVFFTLLHFDPRGIPAYLFSALVLCAALLASRSLITVILIHFFYNLFGLFGDPVLSVVFNATGGSWLFVFVVIALFLGGAALFCGEAARLYRGHAGRPPKGAAQTALPPRESLRRLGRHLIEPPAIFCYMLYILAVIFT